MKIRYSSLHKPNSAEEESHAIRPLIERTPKRTSWEDALKEYEKTTKVRVIEAPVEIQQSKD